jgi:salicylate hydroxylase
VQRQAARNGQHYHLKGVSAMVRNAAMGVMGGEHLLRHYDWLYDWRPPAALSLT